MSESKNSKKKALAIFILVFLACGGGIFLFLVFQGLGEFKPGDKGNFHYGFGARNALMPLLNFFSPKDSDLFVPPEKRRSRGVDTALLDGSRADVSDWMAKSDASAGGAPSGKGGRGGGASSARTPIPGMGGGLGGAGGSGGGGGSQTTAFGGGSSGNTKISKGGGAGAGGADMSKGTLGALATTRAIMKEGIRSGSAMAAKSKWDQAYGMGGAGKASGGQMAYGKSGLIKLDAIKKGDIADLKNINPSSLSDSAVPAPTEDKSAKDSLKDKLKGSEGGDAAAAAANQIASNAAQGKGGDGSPKNTDRGPSPTEQAGMPPDDVFKAAAEQFCPPHCNTGAEPPYKDGSMKFEKQPDGSWNTTFTGKDGNGQDYTDTQNMKTGEDGKMIITPVGSQCGTAGGTMENTQFGTCVK